jgi:SAM-dependent methyltransferase
MNSREIPLPPIELRRSIGSEDPAIFDNPDGKFIFGDKIDPAHYARVFDFGCGCGRVARQLLQQKVVPEKYVGIDLNKKAIDWCVENLSPINEKFSFRHHNIYNAGLNPSSISQVLPFYIRDKQFSLVNATSVFTHVIEENVEFYLNEISNILDRDGIFRSTWFLFNKKFFPFMQEYQNALYINLTDPTNAVVFDSDWLRAKMKEANLSIYKIHPPSTRGFQWEIYASRVEQGLPEAEFPLDEAPFGIRRSPPLQGDSPA